MDNEDYMGCGMAIIGVIIIMVVLLITK